MLDPRQTERTAPAGLDPATPDDVAGGGGSSPPPGAALVGGLRRLCGPGVVIAVAYVDPGNFATNTEAGASLGVQLLWVVVVASAAAMLVQYLAAKAGSVTGRSLPELCRERYSRPVNRFLWVQGEIVSMATDVAEVLGAAVALSLLFGLPLPVGGLLAGAFGVGLLALLVAGLAASGVGTLAGDIVMAGFVRLRVSLVTRRLLTLGPAMVVLILPVSTTQALVISQVVLSFGVPFALLPLVHITADRALMGRQVNRRLTTVLALVITLAVCALNVAVISALFTG